jgi:hypothetical protein
MLLNAIHVKMQSTQNNGKEIGQWLNKLVGHQPGTTTGNKATLILFVGLRIFTSKCK